MDTGTSAHENSTGAAAMVSVHHDRFVPAPTPGTPLVAFRSPRRTLWGHGEALRIEVPAPWSENLHLAQGRLAELPGAVAFTALPYDRTAAGSLVVPAVLHVRTAEGEQSTIVVGDGVVGDGVVGDGVVGDAVSSSSLIEPAEFRIHCPRTPSEWTTAVAAARDRIRAGELTKVVLGREIQVTAETDFDPATVWLRLTSVHPGALAFAVDGFVGASPELLVSRHASTVRAQPMAGTMPRTGEPEADQRRAGELLASEKNRIEHQITIDAVHDALLGWCSYLDAEPSPSVVAAGPVQHLATLVEGHLSAPEPSVLELVAALHPTPAVGGWPSAAAAAVQAELEGAERGRWAGPVGWVDSEGNGAFAVGIRSAELSGPVARLFAGVGVVADSDPVAELAEARAKAQALLSCLVRP